VKISKNTGREFLRQYEVDVVNTRHRNIISIHQRSQCSKTAV